MTTRQKSSVHTLLGGVAVLAVAFNCLSAQPSVSDAVFLLGQPDGSALEFGLCEEQWPAYARTYPEPIVFRVGRSKLQDWPYIHPSHHDRWAGSRTHTFTVIFTNATPPTVDLNLIIGLADAHTPSLVVIGVNGQEVGRRRAPRGLSVGSDPYREGQIATMVFPVPARALKAGENHLTITLSDGSWIIYDYVYLGPRKEPLPLKGWEPPSKENFLAGPMKGVEEIVFATRKVGDDGHWYANIGYYADCELEFKHGNPFTHNGKRVTYRLGGKLGVLNVRRGEVRWLIDDPRGGVRDPVVHYDGRTILFSYRKGDGEHYHLYTIQSDGTGLRQLTDGDYDDFEPCWLPDGGIVFVSTRAKRWVNCWLTQVATLHRCDADGRNIRMISANNEHDNTPWVLPDGRILYQRWEYVDRSQVDYHHLWTANPDGTAQMVYFGNQRPGIVMIDAKPIPQTSKVVAIFSPGHGQREHAGAVAVVDPAGGPDDAKMARTISRGRQDYRDPWAFSEEAFMVAAGAEIQLMNSRGAATTLYRLPEPDVREGYWLHEPRPLIPREREKVIVPLTHPGQTTGRVVLANIYEGRNMQGVKPGEIKKLLVLETLPKPVNFTGGMDPLTYGGSFTLERILGTVPVEPDGSAYLELPALRGLFFVALDENDMAVKRMQSFLTVQPGELVSCVGCHEQRTKSYLPAGPLQAVRRPPSRIEPIADAPEIFDFPRDIQPILNRLCVDCHDYTATPRGGPRAGGVILTGDHGPMFSHAYFTLTVKQLFRDGRNEARSNYRPRELGSSASRILKMLDGTHYGVQATQREKQWLRLWIESGAVYPGTYAALGAGSIGGYQENEQIHVDTDWPTTRAGAEVIGRRCASCHTGHRTLPSSMSDELGISFWRFDLRDPRLQYSRHIMFNLTRPEKSLLALAPLAREAGGFGLCTNSTGAAVFTETSDPDWQKLVAMAQGGKDYLAKIKRFDMPGYVPRHGWVREMKRYGILPMDLDVVANPVNYYEVEQKYWQSLWPRP